MPTGIISNLIKYALLLGAAGQLIEATRDMRHRAAKATCHGTVSLRALNRSLMGRPRQGLKPTVFVSGK